MLTWTFCHIPGLGPGTERSLWSAGVTSWEDLLRSGPAGRPYPFRRSWQVHLEESITRYAARNPGYFFDNLPPSCHWRLYPDFQDCCAFLDIETTGLSASAEVTTIALFDGKTVRHYVNGSNLEDFPADVARYQLLVTYNGKCFDVPFLERYFRMRLPQAHIDLRYPLRKLGFKGGLKGCERQLGIERPGLEGLDGYAAVLLWYEYRRRKNAKALETLLAYNVQDAVNLQSLMVIAYNEQLKRTPFFQSHALPAPPTPEVPFRPDPDTVQRVAGQCAGGWPVSGVPSLIS